MTKTVLVVSSGGYKDLHTDHSVTWAGGEPAKLKATDGNDFTLFVAMKYQTVEAAGARGPLKVATIGYAYELRNLDGGEIVLYHWHPWIPDDPDTHMHIGGPQLATDSDISRKTQLPCGRTSLEEVIGFCVAKQNAKPLRDDWEDTLNLSKEIFERWKTWPEHEPVTAN